MALAYRLRRLATWVDVEPVTASPAFREAFIAWQNYGRRDPLEDLYGQVARAAERGAQMQTMKLNLKRAQEAFSNGDKGGTEDHP